MAFYLDFEGVKDIHVLSVLVWDFRGCLRFLTRVWLPDLNLDMVFGLCHTNGPNFGSLSWFWKCKDGPCLLSPDLGLWRMLEVPDRGLSSWSWFEYGHWYLIHPWSKFLSLSSFWKCKEQPFAQVLIWGFGWCLRFLTWVWHFDLHLDLVTSLWYANLPNFPSLYWLWRCKEPSFPLGPDFLLWRMLEVPDWGLASWSWLGYGHWFLIHPSSKFWLSILI